jgi:glutathione S-transferase
MSELRIFSYLPNPRIWKATIAARLCGVAVEVRGGSPRELESWLWDFDARPLSADEPIVSQDVRVGTTGFNGRTLHKTDAFMAAHPFGTVPAAFSPDGKIGIFESNSIMRAVARLGEGRFPLYGRGAYEASRVDSFLDASLVFAREAQTYLLSMLGGTVSAEIQSRAREALTTYLAGIDRALTPQRDFLVGDDVTLADICFVAELGLFWNERTRSRELEAKGLEPILNAKVVDGAFPRAMAHFARLRQHSAFAPDVEPYMAKIERASAEPGGGR